MVNIPLIDFVTPLSSIGRGIAQRRQDREAAELEAKAVDQLIYNRQQADPMNLLAAQYSQPQQQPGMTLASLGGQPGAMPPQPQQPPQASPHPMSMSVAQGHAAVSSQPQPTQPRGIRNNNPLNIESGAFTQRQPGFAGSDGRFARFETPEQGMAAADNLLQVYSNRHGLNTIEGIVGRWAPAGDGNPVRAYTNYVATRMGVAPNQPLDMSDPQVRARLAEAMAAFENGQGRGQGAQPVQVAQSGGGMPMPRQQQPQIPRELMLGLLRNPQTRQMGLSLIQSMRQGNSWTQPFQVPGVGTVQMGQDGKMHVLRQEEGAPSSVREFEYGQSRPEFFDHQERMKRAGAQNITVGGGRFGTIPPGYELIETPEGARMQPIPGGPAEQAMREDERKRQAGTDVTLRAAQTVFEDTDRAIRVLDEYGWASAGFGGLTDFIPELPAQQLKQHLESIKGNIGIDSLLAIKASGAGLGHIPQTQLEMLAGLLGRLDTRMTQDDLRWNLTRIQEIYADIVEKSGGDPNELYRQRQERIGSAGKRQEQSGQSRPAPQPGTVIDGYRFRGGDPSDRSSWEPIT